MHPDVFPHDSWFWGGKEVPLGCKDVHPDVAQLWTPQRRGHKCTCPCDTEMTPGLGLDPSGCIPWQALLWAGKHWARHFKLEIRDKLKGWGGLGAMYWPKVQRGAVVWPPHPKTLSVLAFLLQCLCNHGWHFLLPNPHPSHHPCWMWALLSELLVIWTCFTG